MRLLHRIGHRGGALLFFCALDLVYGSVLITARPLPGSTLDALSRSWPPLSVWGAAWLLAGLVCGIFAFKRWDVPGFVAAMGIKFGWACANLVTFAAGGSPWALVSTAIWIMTIGLVALISSWPEPPRVDGGG